MIHLLSTANPLPSFQCTPSLNMFLLDRRNNRSKNKKYKHSCRTEVIFILYFRGSVPRRPIAPEAGELRHISGASIVACASHFPAGKMGEWAASATIGQQEIKPHSAKKASTIPLSFLIQPSNKATCPLDPISLGSTATKNLLDCLHFALTAKFFSTQTRAYPRPQPPFPYKESASYKKLFSVTFCKRRAPSTVCAWCPVLRQ